MKRSTAERLIEINTQFYAEEAQSFDQTRQAPWHGWYRSVDSIIPMLGRNNADQEISVLDLGCGNLRFEDFLVQRFSDQGFRFYAIDNCDALLSDKANLNFIHADILSLLLQGSLKIGVSPCNLSVCFGLMHHVPSLALRKQVLNFLVEQTEPGGYLICSFWQFMDNSALAARALAITPQAQEELGIDNLDAGDYFLGWQHREGVYRYCHHFSREEIDELIAAVAHTTVLIDRFNDDGKTQKQNAYIVLQRN
jgi:tRNA (uracil-5-)-methyltransferase TRM9